MSDDPTLILPDEQGKTTQPMLETLLEEVRGMGAEIGENSYGVRQNHRFTCKADVPSHYVRNRTAT